MKGQLKVNTLKITVAAVISHNNQFLMVYDNTPDGIKLNQPAGHLEFGENLLSAIIREVKEETSLDFTPTSLVGIYNLVAEKTQYMRFCFRGELNNYLTPPKPSLNDEVLEAKWLDLATIKTSSLRSLLVIKAIDDFLVGKNYPLTILQ